jgi:small subunit ribosomal protein S20
MAQKKIKRHPGAIKANRQSLRRNSRNRNIKKGIRLATRAVLEAIGKDQAKAAELNSTAAAALDKAAKRGTIHWKTAARRKARLARRLAAPAAAPAAA